MWGRAIPAKLSNFWLGEPNAQQDPCRSHRSSNPPS